MPLDKKNRAAREGIWTEYPDWISLSDSGACLLLILIIHGFPVCRIDRQLGLLRCCWRLGQHALRSMLDQAGSISYSTRSLSHSSCESISLFFEEQVTFVPIISKRATIRSSCMARPSRKTDELVHRDAAAARGALLSRP